MTNASEGKFYPEIWTLCVMSANTDIQNESWQEGNKKPTLKTWDRKARRSHINHPMPLVEEAWLLHFVGLSFYDRYTLLREHFYYFFFIKRTYYYESLSHKKPCFAIWAQCDFLKSESSSLPLFWHTMSWSTFGSLPETKEIWRRFFKKVCRK